MAIYDQLYIFLNGSLLAENTSIDVSYEGENQAVLTTVQGYTGESPSPKMLVITADNVVPPTGFEVDYFQKFLDTEEVEIKAQSGATGESLISKGYLQAPKVSSGVGKVTTVSFGFRGKPAKFE